jgi:hypothetical protein
MTVLGSMEYWIKAEKLKTKMLKEGEEEKR